MSDLQNGVAESYGQATQLTLSSRREGVLVIGGGPAGLSVASLLRRRGERVTVVERRSFSELGKTDTDQVSHNFTLVDRSMDFLTHLGTPVDDLAIPFDARQFWLGDGRVSVHRYGLRRGDRLHSIPRRDLVRRLFAYAEHLGVEFLDSTEVLRLDARRGSVLAESSANGVVTIGADHIIAADGANSFARDDIARQVDCDCSRRGDGYCYVTARIAPAAAQRAGLAQSVIHFVPGAAGMDVGLPNKDGSVSLLCERPNREGLRKVDTDHDFQFFAGGCPPLLRRHIPDFDAQIRRSPVRRFKYCEVGQWFHGNAILIGDAARTIPPYCGQGVNAALHDVASFVMALDVTGSEWSRAGSLYEQDRREHCRRIGRLTASHGQCVQDGRFGRLGWRLCDRVQRLAERIFGCRSRYQRLVFDCPFPDIVSMQAMLDAETIMRTAKA